MLDSPARLTLLCFVFVCPAVCFITTPTHAQTGQQRGATLGGVAGAIAGGIIGENNNEAGAGAVIGGAIGAVTGGLLGNANDRDQAAQAQRDYQYQLQQQQYRQSQQQRPTQPVATTTLSMNDVVSMSRSGISDTVIINQVRQRGIQRSLQVSDIIALHQQGVSENVITEIQRTPAGAPAQTPSTVPTRSYVPAPQPTPVIIQQPRVIYHHDVLPSYPIHSYHHPSHHYHSPRRQYRRSSGWGFHLDL